MTAIKVIVIMHYTKRDVYGNVYRAAEIVNPKTGKRLVVCTPHASNIRHILYNAGILNNDGRTLFEREICTNKVALSSLPEGEYLNECHYDKAWKKALNALGYIRLNKPNQENTSR